MPSKKKGTRRRSRATKPDAIADPTPVAKSTEDKVPAAVAITDTSSAKATEEPVLQPTGEFYGLKCTDQRPPGFHGGRFERSRATVIGRRLMRSR